MRTRPSISPASERTTTRSPSSTLRLRASASDSSTASRSAPVRGSVSAWIMELNCLPRRVLRWYHPSGRSSSGGATATARLEDAQTAYKVARIELDKARADLADRTLRAPFDGVSGLAQVETGDRIAEDDVIASFDDRSRILVEFDLPEALLGRIAVGQEIAAGTPSVEGRDLSGEITAIDSRVDPVTRTARIRAAIDNSADILRPGASFSLRIDLPGGSFPAVPELALQFSGSGLHVWRVRDETVERVDLRLVRRRVGTVIVDGPLAEGDAVVVEGTQRLRPGARVNVMNSAAAGSS